MKALSRIALIASYAITAAKYLDNRTRNTQVKLLSFCCKYSHWGMEERQISRHHMGTYGSGVHSIVNIGNGDNLRVDTVNRRGRDIHADPESKKAFADLYKPTTLEIVADDVSGTMFTVVGANGRNIAAGTNRNNELVIDDQTYREVDDDLLKFEVCDGKLFVLHDGKALEGYTPIELHDDAFLLRKLNDVSQNATLGSFRELNGKSVESLQATAATPFQTNAAVGEGELNFATFLSRSLEGSFNGLEKQKFQYGGYDKSTVKTVHTWDDVLKSRAVSENHDGTVTLRTSAERPRVQFYPDDDVAGGRRTTSTEDLRDVSFEFSIENWKRGDAAWIYELHKVGDGQAMAIGYNQEGKLMLANGKTNETDISLVGAGKIAIEYNGNNATVSVYNRDGALRGSEAIKVSGSEVHVKGIELYNRRAAADTEATVTFGRIKFADP